MGGGGGTPQPIYYGQDPIPVSPFAWLYAPPPQGGGSGKGHVPGVGMPMDQARKLLGIPEPPPPPQAPTPPPDQPPQKRPPRSLPWVDVDLPPWLIGGGGGAER